MCSSLNSTNEGMAIWNIITYLVCVHLLICAYIFARIGFHFFFSEFVACACFYLLILDFVRIIVWTFKSISPKGGTLLVAVID